jgi:hypothetical protein
MRCDITDDNGERERGGGRRSVHEFHVIYMYEWCIDSSSLHIPTLKLIPRLHMLQEICRKFETAYK